MEKWARFMRLHNPWMLSVILNIIAILAFLVMFITTWAVVERCGCG